MIEKFWDLNQYSFGVIDPDPTTPYGSVNTNSIAQPELPIPYGSVNTMMAIPYGSVNVLEP